MWKLLPIKTMLNIWGNMWQWWEKEPFQKYMQKHTKPRKLQTQKDKSVHDIQQTIDES